MSENIELVYLREDKPRANWREAGLRADTQHFDQISMVFHWVTVLLIVAQLATAWLLNEDGKDASALLAAHRSMGILTWIMVAARLIWRCGFAHLPPFPTSMPKLQRRMAMLNEYALYMLLLAQPLTGLVATLLGGRPFALFAWRVPAFLAPDKAASHLFHSIHHLGAWALIALIALHTAAALFHGLILRDGVLQRMLPWTARQAGSEPEAINTDQ
jgi:superoxide oxidase